MRSPPRENLVLAVPKKLMLARMVATGGPPPEPVTIVQLQFLPQLLPQFLPRFLAQFLLQPPILRVSSSYGDAIQLFLFIVTIYI
jgi:hypothetical protein